MDVATVTSANQSYYEAQQIHKVESMPYAGIKFQYGFFSDIANINIDLGNLLYSPVLKLNYTKEEVEELARTHNGYIPDNALIERGGLFNEMQLEGYNWRSFWSPLEFDLNFCTGYSEQIGLSPSYTLALYEQYKEVIQNIFTDIEQDELMVKLHGFIAQNIEKTANAYVDEIGGFLEEHGFKNEENTLKESVLTLYEEVFAKLDMSLADVGIFVSENRSGNFYSSDDLHALAFMSKAVLTGLNYHDGSNDYTRDEYPAPFVLYAAQKESIYQAFSVSDSVRNKIETAFSNRVNNVINETNKNNQQYIEKRYNYSSTPLTAEELSNYAPFDKEPIWQVVNDFIEDLQSDMSIADALKKTDYFNTFFKDQTQNDNVPGLVTLASVFNRLTHDLGLVSKLLIEGINKKNVEWTA